MPNLDSSPHWAAAAYLAHLQGEGRSRHTLDSVRLDLAQLARFLGPQPLASVSSADLRAFLNWLARQHANRVSSLRRKTSTLKGFFQFCHDRRFIAHDPAASLLYPPAEPRRARPLTAREGDAILEAADAPAWRALVGCLLDCGLKRDEVTALRWDDLELDSDPPPGRLHVRHRHTSQRARRRTLALSARLAAALRDHAADADRSGAVFAFSPRGVDFIVETSARRAGVRAGRKVTPQMLRDAYACARLATFIEREARLADDPRARHAAQREHDRTLLRELGLAPDSVAAQRYRRMLEPAQSDRPEEPVLLDG